MHTMTAAPFPAWFHFVSIVSLAAGLTCAVVIALDEVRRPQKMWIMAIVWPATALFGSVLWLAAYYAFGRSPPASEDSGTPPFPAMVLKGSSHCGAGCAIGDLVAEWLAYLVPAVAVAFGWHSVFAEKTFAVWVLDFILAYGLGVVFQYYTIKPMRGLSVGAGIVAALKADTLSISAWQIGMYGVMALIQFAWLRPDYGRIAEVASPEFWCAMQLAMLGGFLTSYPVNWWLIRIGWKEKM